MGDGPPRHPRSRGTRLTVLGADAGTWRELQAAVSRGEAGRAAGRRSRGLSDIGPPPAPPPPGPGQGMGFRHGTQMRFRINSVSSSPRNRPFQCFRGTSVSPTRGRPACVPAPSPVVETETRRALAAGRGSRLRVGAGGPGSGPPGPLSQVRGFQSAVVSVTRRQQGCL